MEQQVSTGLSVEEAFRNTLSLLHGSYAIGLLDAENPNMIYVAKKQKPAISRCW